MFYEIFYKIAKATIIIHHGKKDDKGHHKFIECSLQENKKHQADYGAFFGFRFSFHQLNNKQFQFTF